jgi:hypothetical protein
VNVVDFDDKYIVSASGDSTIKVVGGGATMVVLVLLMVLLCGATYCPGVVHQLLRVRQDPERTQEGHRLPAVPRQVSPTTTRSLSPANCIWYLHIVFTG